MVCESIVAETQNYLFCSTFPKKCDDEIFRDSFLQVVYDSFRNGQEVIAIEGESGTGKTVFLAQFARQYKQQVFSFFIGTDYSTSNPDAFLLDMCEQMKNVPELNMNGKLSEVDAREYDSRQLFSRFMTEMRKAAQKGKGPYFFVIDGLQNLNSHFGEEFRNLIPSGSTTGIYVLLSGHKETIYPAVVTKISMMLFSEDETRSIFKELNLDEKVLKNIHVVSQGVPGYVSELKRQILSNRDAALLENIPKTLSGLMEKEWERITCESQDLKVLSALIFSPEMLTIESLSEIVRKDRNEIEEELNKLRIVQINPKTQQLDLKFYKNFLMNKLEECKESTYAELISYYKNKKSDPSAIHSLSLIYKSNKDYAALMEILKPEKMIDIMLSGKSISVVRNNIKLLSEIAVETEDWQRVSIASLADALITEFVLFSPVLVDHVEALLALEKDEEALHCALQGVLPEDILRLLTPVCIAIQAKGLPIPESAQKALEDAVERLDNTIQYTPWIIEDIYGIAEKLFQIESDLALKLLKRVSEIKGISADNGNLIDMLYARLAIQITAENEQAEKVRSQIGDESLREFSIAAHPTYSNIEFEAFYERIEGLNDLSAKLFAIKSWGEENLKADELPQAVFWALELMFTADEYTPSLIYLCELAHLVLNFKDTSDSKLALEQLRSLQEAALKSPIEELVRLEITLARIEAKVGLGCGENHFIKTYFQCCDFKDLDVKCNTLGRVLLSLPYIFPNDQEFEKEVRNELEIGYKKLIDNSADHYEIANKLISSLVRKYPEMAVGFAKQLNIQARRDKAFGEMINVYTRQKADKIELDFLVSLINAVEERTAREWVITQTLKRLVNKDDTINEATQKYFYSILDEIENYRAKAICSSCVLKWHLNDEKIQENLFDSIINSLSRINPKWNGVKIGYDIVIIIASFDKVIAGKLLEKINELFLAGPFNDKRISESYVRTIRLGIRMLKGIAALPEYILFIERAIASIPSTIHQCSLQSALAHSLLEMGNREKFNEVMQKCYAVLENCDDSDEYADLLYVIAPMLYQYERQLVYTSMEKLSTIHKDNVLMSILDNLVTKAAHDEPVDSRSVLNPIGHEDMQRFCEVLKLLDTDTHICQAVNTLVNCLIERERQFKSRAIFQEKQILYAAKAIREVIESKLPDSKNIQHDGYKCICYGSLQRLRMAAANRGQSIRANWDNICLSWEELHKMASNIVNGSDRVYVYAMLAEEASFVDRGWTATFAAAAEENLEQINNSTDRAERYCEVAKAWSRAQKLSAATSILQQAFEIAQKTDKDSLFETIVEQAYDIDSNLANSIASKIDSPMRGTQLNDDIVCMTLKAEPVKLGDYSYEQVRRIFPDSIRSIYSSFSSGRTVLQQEKVIGKWVQMALGQDPISVNCAVSWYVENACKQKKKNTKNIEFDSLARGLQEIVVGIEKISEQFEHNSNGLLASNIYSKLDCDTIIISATDGERRALDIIKEWTSQNVQSYLKIYEPYFKERFLPLLTEVSNEARVQIMIARKTSEIDGIEAEFRGIWKEKFDQQPPDTTVYVYHTPSGKTPMHDRYFITDCGGLALGTSINGFGSKDSTIKKLSNEEKTKTEFELVNPLLSSPPIRYENERLRVYVFSL